MAGKYYPFYLSLFFSLHATISFAQINIGSLDTAVWRIDSVFEKSITIIPRASFQSDTTIYFFENINGKERTVMTISCRKKSRWITGCFNGYKQFINSNNFFILPCNLDSLDFIHTVDCVFTTDGVTHYFIKRDLFKSEPDYSMLTLGFDNFIEVSRQSQGHGLPTNYYSSIVAVVRKEPPYDYFSYISNCEIMKDSVISK